MRLETKFTTAAPTAQTEDRSNLLKDLATLTLEAAHGVQRVNDQQVSQLLGGLVRSKLMSADDSYLLRDRILDQAAIDNALDHRIEAALKRRGIMSDEIIRQARTTERPS